MKRFSNIGAHDFPIRGLAPRSDQTTWIYRGRIDHTIFRKSTVIDAITKAVENKQPLHLVPSVPNFPAVNSILYDPNDPVFRISKAGSNVVHLFQTSALPEAGDGASCLLCRRTWHPLSKCKSWMVILAGPNGLERWINTYWGWKSEIYSYRVRYSYPATGGATGTVLNICL